MSSAEYGSKQASAMTRYFLVMMLCLIAVSTVGVCAAATVDGADDHGKVISFGLEDDLAYCNPIVVNDIEFKGFKNNFLQNFLTNISGRWFGSFDYLDCVYKLYHESVSGVIYAKDGAQDTEYSTLDDSYALAADKKSIGDQSKIAYTGKDVATGDTFDSLLIILLGSFCLVLISIGIRRKRSMMN